MLNYPSLISSEAARALLENREQALAFAEVSLSGPGNLIITRFLDDTVPLGDAVGELSADQRRTVLASLGETAGRIHGARIYHSDWSTKNFLIYPEEGTAWRAYVVDTEAVRFRARLTGDRIIKNLGQLNDVPGFTDAKYFSKTGAKCFGFSPTMFGAEEKFADLFHGHDERIPVEGFKKGLEILLDTVHELVC